MACVGRAPPGSEEAQEGSAQLEVALPSRLDHQPLDRASGECMRQQAERVVIGMDPRKRLATIELMNGDETVLGGGRYGTDEPGFAAMMRYVRQILGSRKDRLWTVE